MIEEQVMEREFVELIAASFIFSVRNVIKCCREGDLRITQTYRGILVPLHPETLSRLTDVFIVSILYMCPYDLACVLLAFRLTLEVNWDALATRVNDLFVWHDFVNGFVCDLDCEHERQLDLTVMPAMTATTATTVMTATTVVAVVTVMTVLNVVMVVMVVPLHDDVFRAVKTPLSKTG